MVIEYCSLLETERKFVIANQLLKSGTSIGANAMEAQNAESKADFIHKFKIAAIPPKAIRPFNRSPHPIFVKPYNMPANARIPPATNKIVFVSTDGIPPIDLIIKYIAVPSAAIPTTAPIPLNKLENQPLSDLLLT